MMFTMCTKAQGPNPEAPILKPDSHMNNLIGFVRCIIVELYRNHRTRTFSLITEYVRHLFSSHAAKVGTLSTCRRKYRYDVSWV